MKPMKFTDEFLRDAVAQITEHGYLAKEVSKRLRVSTHSLYAWKRKFAKPVWGEGERDAEIRRLQHDWRGVGGARYPEKATAYFAMRRACASCQVDFTPSCRDQRASEHGKTGPD